MSDVFLGEPPPDIKRWILTHKLSFWTSFIKKLENFESSTLPQVGTYVTIPYLVDINGSPINTQWQILGYNKSIPRYVKYKNVSGDIVYMDVFSNNKLLYVFNGANVYKNKDGTGFIGTVENPTGSYSYGDKNTYTVPQMIDVNENTYTFCGYNVTIQSKYGIATKYNGKTYVFAQFNSSERSDWKTSKIRQWLNNDGVVSDQKWQSVYNDVTSGTIPGLLGRFPDQDFMHSVIPTISRIWVYSNWSDKHQNGIETYEDKFWLLGQGNVNDGEYEWEGCYDTSYFGEIFPNDSSRIRRVMDEFGNEGNESPWWLRTAGPNGDYNVGCVFTDGSTLIGNSTLSLAILPACVIG